MTNRVPPIFDSEVNEVNTAIISLLRMSTATFTLQSRPRSGGGGGRSRKRRLFDIVGSGYRLLYDDGLCVRPDGIEPVSYRIIAL